MMLDGPQVRFWQAPGAPTPPPPGFVQNLGQASANSGTSVSVPVTHEANTGNQVLVFVTTTTSRTVTSVTDSAGSVYVLKNAGHPASNSWLAYATLSAPLTSSDSVVVHYSSALASGNGSIAIVAEYSGLATFLGSTSSTVNGYYAVLNMTVRGVVAPGALVVATLRNGWSTLPVISPTASWAKRLQVTYNAGPFAPTAGTELLASVLADRIVTTVGTPVVSVTWSDAPANPTPPGNGGYLACWAFSLA